MSGSVMRCPKCGEMARRVKECKAQDDDDGWSMVIRRRYCGCGNTFTTYECYEYADVEVAFRMRKLLGDLQSGLEEIDSIVQPAQTPSTQ